MEKTIPIGGQDVRFKTNGIALLIYKSQFGRDLIPDILKLVDASKLGDLQNGDATRVDISSFDISTLYDICWVFAKIADASIPPVLEWAGRFDAFPIIDVFKEIIPLLMECISCSAEVKNAVATAGLKTKAMRSKRSRLFSWQRR